MGIQDDAVVTCAAYRVTENGQTWCFTTSPGEELLDAAQTLRRCCTDTEYSTGKFISLYSQAQPITPEKYQSMIRLRMENTGKVTACLTWILTGGSSPQSTSWTVGQRGRCGM